MQVMEDYDHEKGDGAILHNMIESIKPNFQQGSFNFSLKLEPFDIGGEWNEAITN